MRPRSRHAAGLCALAGAWLAGVLALCPYAGAANVEEDRTPILLVAHPRMPDANFAGTVLVVIFPQDAGPLGLVLNRPSGMNLGDLFGPDRPDLAGHEDPVHLGGPVDPTGMLFLFRAKDPPLRALPVVDDILVSGDGEIFESLVADAADPGNRRFFAGHAGWAEGQLDREIDHGDWYVLAVDPAVVMSTDDDGLWELMIERATALRANRDAPRERPARRGDSIATTGEPGRRAGFATRARDAGPTPLAQ